MAPPAEPRTIIRVDFFDQIHKSYLGPAARERFDKEVRILEALEERGCPNVPRVVETDVEGLRLVMSGCAQDSDWVTEEQAAALFAELERDYGVRVPKPTIHQVLHDRKNERYLLAHFDQAELLPEPNPADAEKRDRSLVWRASWSACSRKGETHKNNEDSHLVVGVSDDRRSPLLDQGQLLLDPSHLVLAVSDGMGGRAAGDFASRFILNHIKRDALDLYEVIQEETGIQRALTLLTKSTHEGLLIASEREPSLLGCGATLTLAWVTAGILHWVHVGDSRLYLRDGDEIAQLTDDDCTLWEQFNRGEITEYNYRTDPKRSLLSDALGGGPHQVKPQTGSIQITPGARLMLCSDGIMDGLWNRQIEELLCEDKPVAEIAKDLVEQSCLNDPSDDTTVIVAEFDVV